MENRGHTPRSRLDAQTGNLPSLQPLHCGGRVIRKPHMDSTEHKKSDAGSECHSKYFLDLQPECLQAIPQCTGETSNIRVCWWLLLLLCNSQGSILYCPFRPGQALWLGPPTYVTLELEEKTWKSATKVTSPEPRTERSSDRLGERETGRDHWSCNLLLQIPTAMLPLELPIGPLPPRTVVLKRPEVKKMEDTEGFTVLSKSCKQEILKHPFMLAVFATLLVSWSGYYEYSCLWRSQSIRLLRVEGNHFGTWEPPQAEPCNAAIV